MKAKLVIHTSYCVGRFNKKFSLAQKFLDNEVLKDSAPYVPFRTGYLEKSGITGTVIGSGKVIYNAPYAKKKLLRKTLQLFKRQAPSSLCFLV